MAEIQADAGASRLPGRCRDPGVLGRPQLGAAASALPSEVPGGEDLAVPPAPGVSRGRHQEEADQHQEAHQPQPQAEDSRGSQGGVGAGDGGGVGGVPHHIHRRVLHHQVDDPEVRLVGEGELSQHGHQEVPQENRRLYRGHLPREGPGADNELRQVGGPGQVQDVFEEAAAGEPVPEDRAVLRLAARPQMQDRQGAGGEFGHQDHIQRQLLPQLQPDRGRDRRRQEQDQAAAVAQSASRRANRGRQVDI